jgi:YidC/Oxa1 family membrane protein insertase
MNRTTGIILYFIFVMTFLLLWDYFVLRPKREELLKQQTEKKEETVIKASPEPPLITLKSDGYEYLIDENTGAIYGLNDKRHKARVTGYIIKPLRDTQIFNLENLGNYRLKITLKEERPLQITLPITEDPKRERKELFVQYLDGKLKKFNYQNANQEFYTDSVRWIGLRSRYYMVSVWDFRGFVVSFKDGDRITLRLYPKGDKEFFVFFGPAEKRLLSMEPNMEKAFDLGGGWTTFLAWPIYWVLTFFEGLTKNYGIAIILLALFIKLLTSPLSFNMYKASAKMQELKPKLEKIQKLYGNDPERLQWETMKLYREAGFNPFSGCLPLFLQLPIFFALYQVLQNSIELKGAEFIFWIKDLSARDPYYVLPIIMGGVSVLNAYLQPNVDPQSKRTSILISLLFVFLFLTFPAGIVLYWLTYSLLGILEQRIYKLLWKV